jgi:hypothetical protein
MEKIDGEEKLLAETPQVSQMVKCDVCGRHYNQRYLTSHKRLSHNNKSESNSVDETKAMETILALYKQMSAKARKELLQRLTGAAD